MRRCVLGRPAGPLSRTVGLRGRLGLGGNLRRRVRSLPYLNYQSLTFVTPSCGMCYKKILQEKI